MATPCFDAAFLTKLEYLTLVARRRYQGTLMAQRRSGQLGTGQEFAEHRPYSASDDLRYLDWNVYARHNALLIKPAQDLCLTCHGPASPSGPHAASLQDHTHHAPESAGSQCVACHMPKIEQTIANVSVRSHTFAFIRPTAPDTLKIPNVCTGCHDDKTTDWARQALSGWSGVSPWRVE